MYNQETKEWSAPPPEYACIQGSEESMTTNLAEYISMSETKGRTRGRAELLKQVKERYGVTMTLAELEEFFDTSL